MAALGWLLNLDFAASGVSQSASVQTYTRDVYIAKSRTDEVKIAKSHTKDVYIPKSHTRQVRI